MEIDCVLASSSPRRRELLSKIGVSFTVDPAGIDETQRPGESPYHLVRRLAAAKAVAVALRHPHSLVIGSDTVVAQGGEVFGKPGSQANAFAMLERLSGKAHQVYTAVAVWSACEARGLVRVAIADVVFRPLSTDEIAAYVQTREPLDKAGGYAIQGQAGAWVQNFRGDQETVIGLPTTVVQALLTHFPRSCGG